MGSYAAHVMNQRNELASQVKHLTAKVEALKKRNRNLRRRNKQLTTILDAIGIDP